MGISHMRGGGLGLVIAGLFALGGPPWRTRPAAAMVVAVRGGAQDSTPKPSPALTPDEVVGIVLGALRRNDLPVKDRGIAITFEFASPANRAVTGPLERFAELVKNPSYRPMLDHRSATRGEMRVEGDEASQRVTVTDARGERVAYVFMLSRQADGPYKGCWMTDGVLREPEPPRARYRRVAD